MPVVAVLPAIIAVGSVAAGAATGVLVGTTLAFAVVGAVGATLGAVGAVTKNKTLGYIGMGLGAIGAVGGLASAAGVFSEGGLFSSAATSGAIDTTSSFTSGIAGEQGAIPAASAANEAAVEAAYPGQWNVPETAAPVGVPATEPVGSANMQSQPNDLTTLDVKSAEVPAATATSEQTPGGVYKPDGSTPPGGETPGSTTPGATTEGEGGSWDIYSKQAAPSPGTGGTTPEATPATTPGTPAQQTSLNVDTSSTFGPAGANAPKTGLDKIGDVFSSVADWAEKHKVLSQGMMTGASALIAGLKPTTTEAQVNSMNAAAEANNALAKMREQQIANIGAPKAVAFSPPVTGTPAQNAWGYNTPGIINRSPANSVTGVPA